MLNSNHLSGFGVHDPVRYIEIARALGFGQNVKLCLDASDPNSWPGSGTQWLDVSGNGHHFDFGAGGAAPSFAGSGLTKYCLFGGDDLLQINGANPSWVEAMHKDNAAWTLLLPGLWIGAGATAQRVIGNSGASTAKTGFDLRISGSDLFALAVRNGSGSNALDAATSASFMPGASQWHSYSLSFDEAAGASGATYRRGTTTESVSSTFTSPSASSATHSLQIGADGNSGGFLTNGSRMTGLLIVSAALTPAQTLAWFNAIRHRITV